MAPVMLAGPAPVAKSLPPKGSRWKNRRRRRQSSSILVKEKKEISYTPTPEPSGSSDKEDV
jgi:hypothetical protein